MMEFSVSEIILGLLTSGGGAAAVAYGLFRFFGKAWMDELFARRLEAFRHENAKELQSLRAKIDGSLNATIRFQEKEFSALSSCWESLNIAYGQVSDLVGSYQQQLYEDVGSMPEKMRADYLKTLDLLESQRDDILKSSNPTETLMKYFDIIKLNRARKKVQEYVNILYMNEIFIDEDISEDFKSAMNSMRQILSSKEIAMECGDFKMSSAAGEKLTNEVRPMIEAIAPKLRKKFFDRV